jgi:branched-chain amino acid transport system ATP-binding protein
MLEVKGIISGYDDLKVIHSFSMHLNNGEIACIIGPNGSGKSTLLKTIAGLVKPTQGKIVINGEDITGSEPYEILRKGICLLPQGRTAFPLMTVLENLLMGAYIVNNRKEVQERLKEVYDLFPILEERRKDTANKLSGGELAMLCIARALMSHPKIMLLDEPSLGLAPKVINQVYQKIVEINNNGSSMVIVEQNVRKVLKIANYAYVLSSGRKKLEGRCEALLSDDRLKSVYLGSLRPRTKLR